MSKLYLAQTETSSKQRKHLLYSINHRLKWTNRKSRPIVLKRVVRRFSRLFVRDYQYLHWSIRGMHLHKAMVITFLWIFFSNFASLPSRFKIKDLEPVANMPGIKLERHHFTGSIQLSRKLIRYSNI